MTTKKATAVRCAAGVLGGLMLVGVGTAAFAAFPNPDDQSGVDVKVITESINNVTLVGEAEELAAISPSDVIAQVDASAQNITVKGSGQQQFSAQIIVTGTKTVFATGAYSVLCDITVK